MLNKTIYSLKFIYDNFFIFSCTKQNQLFMKIRIRLFQPGILFLIILMGQNLKAQDTIYKNNGTVIYAKINEIGSSTVSFKKTDFPDGPTFVENKTEISEIRFRNGQRQEF